MTSEFSEQINFLSQKKAEAIVIGRMTPEFIKHPFMNMTYNWPNARCAFINMGEPEPVKELEEKQISLNVDILETLHEMVEMKRVFL